MTHPRKTRIPSMTLSFFSSNSFHLQLHFFSAWIARRRRRRRSTSFCATALFNSVFLLFFSAFFFHPGVYALPLLNLDIGLTAMVEWLLVWLMRMCVGRGRWVEWNEVSLWR